MSASMQGHRCPRSQAWVLALATLWLATLGAPAAWGRVQPSDPGDSNGILKSRTAPVVPMAGTDVKNINTASTFATIQDALDDPATLDGHVLEVQVASHAEGIVTVTKGVTIQGGGGGAIVTPTTDTGGSGDARGWFLITAANVTFRNLAFDGSGHAIFQALRFKAAGGLVEDCDFAHVRYSTYLGMAIVSYENLTVRDCTFADIERLGIILFSSAVTAGEVSGCTYTGKGAGDWIDYGVELGGGAVATLTDNTITSCTGVALSDGSNSAAVLVTDYYAPGTRGTLNGNFLNGSTMALAVGYASSDTSVVVAHGNDFSGNGYGTPTTNPLRVVDASANWWGSNVAATVAAYNGPGVDYTPWLHVGTDMGGAGFQGDYSVLDVDDDCPQVGTVNRVQEGVNLAVGSTVNLMPGTYEGQVVVATNNLVLQGAGAGSTILKSPVTLTQFFTTPGPNNNYPVVFVNGATGVEVRDLTVDGFGRGNGNYRFIGVAFWNGGGKVVHGDVVRVEDTPFSGAQHGVGVYAYNDTGGPYSIELDHVTVTDFQKTAIALAGTGLTVNVHDCTTVGAGNTTVTAQNGIQISSGAGGAVTDCSISNIFWIGTPWTASGLLLYGAAPITVSGSVPITNCQSAAYVQNGNATLSGLAVSGNTLWGTILYNSSTSKAGLVPKGAGTRPSAAPFDGSGTMKADLPGIASSLTMNVTNSCYFGMDTANTEGIEVWSSGGPLAVSLTNLEVRDWDYGILVGGAASAVTAHQNSITSNVSAGFDNTYSLAAQNAEFNWWGAADGPSGVGTGSGDAVLGTGVDFTPWRTNGTDPNPACGFTPSDNLVAPVPPTVCISTIHPCVTVPMNISRADANHIRGFSVTFHISSSLALCSGLASITEGTYLNSVGTGGTQFQVLDNGGGSYTVDCAILGLPCGATAPTGNLFDVAVKNSGSRRHGNRDRRLRHVARLQQRAGRPERPARRRQSPSTTRCRWRSPTWRRRRSRPAMTPTARPRSRSTFTAPGDAAVTEVYRAPYGTTATNAYPEYDDMPAAGAPATPGSYPPGAPWTLTGVTATGQTDEVAARGLLVLRCLHEGCVRQRVGGLQQDALARSTTTWATSPTA